MRQIDAFVVVSIPGREIERSDSRPVHSIYGHLSLRFAIDVRDVGHNVSIVVVTTAGVIGWLEGFDEFMWDTFARGKLAMFDDS